jgi:hypothetical protein
MKLYPRSRIVTFRVTDNEYEAIKAMCDGDKNCVSEVAREAVVRGSAGAHWRELRECLAALHHKVDEVFRLLQKERGEFPG